MIGKKSKHLHQFLLLQPYFLLIQHDKTNDMTCVPSEDSDQSVYPHCLIRVPELKTQGFFRRRAKTLFSIGADARGETIHRNYGASWFNGHDSFSSSFDMVRFTQG